VYAHKLQGPPEIVTPSHLSRRTRILIPIPLLCHSDKRQPQPSIQLHCFSPTMRFPLLPFALHAVALASSRDATAQDVIQRLDLHPNVEKGYYRETFRDARTIDGNRSVSTAIYYLLEGSVGFSNWHRVDAAEVWYVYCLLLAACIGRFEKVLISVGITTRVRP
jgi:hypothetical protein